MDNHPATTKASQPDQPPACRWEVHGRNGYWPIDEFHGDAVASVLVITRISQAQAEQIAGALNHAYWLGTQHPAAT